MENGTGKIKKEWRVLFPFSILSKAENLRRRGSILFFQGDDKSAQAVLETRPGFQFRVRLQAPTSYDQDWNSSRMSCTCSTKRFNSYQVDGRWISAEICQHEAAVLMEWEEQHGPWLFEEPPEAREAREKAERERQERLRRQREEEKERQRLKRLEAEQKKIKLPAASLFPTETRKDLFFQLRRALMGLETNRFCADRARSLLEKDAALLRSVALGYAVDGSQLLVANGTVRDNNGERQVQLRLLPHAVEGHHCNCTGGYYYTFTTGELCEHELALLAKLGEYIRRENPGDATDRAADAFFQAWDDADLTAAEPVETQERPRRIVLGPRLQIEGGTAAISYKAGLQGGKQIQLRSFRDFLNAVETRSAFELSKSVRLDFAEADFTEDSLPWLTFLQRRISETDVANERISRGYYTSANLTVKTRDTLVGAVLDRFYELAEGSEVELHDKDRHTNRMLRVGHASPRVSLTAEPLSNPDGILLGVEVSGEMPLVLKGSAGSYMLDTDSLSRITREEDAALRPFRAAADASGQIRFRVGKDRLAEFYYRTVPRLSQSPYVDFRDNCAGQIEALLPPEPQFGFRLDLDAIRQDITCLATVDYGEGSPHALPGVSRAGQYRDAAQEERVLRTVKSWFPDYDSGSGLFSLAYSENALYRILTEALPELERYGPVEGSTAFDRSAVRPMPQLRVGVSVESGLLEIDLLSRDMSPEELLAVLESYRQKKQYHRLRSGAFVRLEEDTQLDELDSLSRGLDFSLEDAIRGGVKLPMYRALYLDSLMEQHDELVGNRDRTYRTLIKSFKTIRDADYEAPETQAEILRPYQLQGYKWFRTLAAAGFGGILADEMGLGKTLQFIALAQAMHDDGEMKRCLVVCPASLVYNWQEEFRRFAPALTVEVMSGTAAARKKHFEQLPEDAVCVTSYDLLRQDIADYRKLSFDLMVLDEAQYIKNQKASMTKAVKAVGARLRFALTGTPIENRLAELWSIFDFLMPGFLYAYPEFMRRFETPVTRQKDAEATARLKQMTAPFILRRLKAEVLRELPAKLEEVRYTRFEDEQRRIYDGQVVRMKQLVQALDGSGEDKLRILAELTRIRQICCDPSLLLEEYHGGSAKRAACLELIRTGMGGGHRMLVFSQFTSMLALLEQDLEREEIPFFKLTGATPKEQRLKLVREFNEGDTPVFLISLKAGGTGLNLTGADVVIHYDPWWNLAAQNQATDRAHRIGQQNQVTVYRIIVKDTIEERILAMQEAKRDLAESVLSGEGTSLSSLSTDELLALLG